MSIPTKAERDREQAEATAVLRAYVAALDAELCPNGHGPITLRQVGRCVYGSCGCRLYQGRLARQPQERWR